MGDEWPPAAIAGVTGIYVMGSSIGGFCGRIIAGMLADLAGWGSAFAVLAAMRRLAAIAVAVTLPRETRFVRSEGLAASAAQMLRHFRNPQLIATFAVGFGTLFNFIATFTYVSFHLAAPPYNFSSTLLGALFFTYLGGTAVAPWTGRLIARFGRRRFGLGVIAMSICCAALPSAPHVPS